MFNPAFNRIHVTPHLNDVCVTTRYGGRNDSPATKRFHDLVHLYNGLYASCDAPWYDIGEAIALEQIMTTLTRTVARRRNEMKKEMMENMKPPAEDRNTVKSSDINMWDENTQIEIPQPPSNSYAPPPTLSRLDAHSRYSYDSYSYPSTTGTAKLVTHGETLHPPPVAPRDTQLMSEMNMNVMPLAKDYNNAAASGILNHTTCDGSSSFRGGDNDNSKFPAAVSTDDNALDHQAHGSGSSPFGDSDNMKSSVIDSNALMSYIVDILNGVSGSNSFNDDDSTYTYRGHQLEGQGSSEEKEQLEDENANEDMSEDVDENKDVSEDENANENKDGDENMNGDGDKGKDDDANEKDEDDNNDEGEDEDNDDNDDDDDEEDEDENEKDGEEDENLGYLPPVSVEWQ